MINNQSVKLECLVDALPKAKLSWFLNGRELTTKDGVKFETDPKTSSNNLLIAKIINTTHLGKYTIKASNIVGETIHTFDLDVLGKKIFQVKIYCIFALFF